MANNIIVKNTTPPVFGVDGKSAYQLAQECGYRGTLEEWLESLKGETKDRLGRDIVETYATKEELRGAISTTLNTEV